MSSLSISEVVDTEILPIKSTKYGLFKRSEIILDTSMRLFLEPLTPEASPLDLLDACISTIADLRSSIECVILKFSIAFMKAFSEIFY